MATHYLGSAIARLNMSARCTKAVHTTTVGPRPKDPLAPPDRFGKWLKVGVQLVQLVGRIFELGQKLGFWQRRRGPAAETS